MTKPARQLKVYEAMDGFRWHIRYNGKIIAESGEAYTRRPDAVKAARRVFAADYPIAFSYETTGGWVEERLR